MITTAQVVGSATASRLCQVPPGPCTVVISNGGTATVYVGEVTTGTATTTNAMPIASGGIVSFSGFAGSPGGALQVVTAVGGSATVGALVSSSYGLPQSGTQ